MTRVRFAFALGATLLLILAGLGPARAGAAGSRPARHPALVYWDQNEEEDLLIDGHVAALIPPWDANGQLCLFPDDSGRFAVGYNPTLPSQNNPGSLKPLKNPPVGEAVYDRHGQFTGQTIFVPGPYALPGSTIGGDIPPAGGAPWQTGAFNNNGSYTGCAFDARGDFFAADLGTAQGQVPIPSSGRLIEWFPPDYTTYCILYGPTEGGDGPHHVDGSGGLQNPGALAVRHADVYLPETGAGRVLRFRHESFPTRAADCGPEGVLTPPARFDVFISTLSFPAAIARDPSCQCWAVSNILGSPAIAWFNDAGTPHEGKGPVPAGPYNPYGLGVVPGGDLYFVDEHIACDASGCGPVVHGEGVFKLTFEHGVASTPQAIVTGIDFPLGITVCDPTHHVCPTPP
jgi:hypothetical protein